MTPARWAQIKEVFEAAHGRPETERAAFVDQVCCDDRSLCDEVKRLLAEEGPPSLASPLAAIAAQSTSIDAGSTLGRYRVEQKLGEGGMGAVYRAVDTQLRRAVALKVLPPEHSEDPQWRRQLLREARAASALNHPNIIAIYEVGADAGVDFIAMEFVDGNPLNQVIRRKALPVKLALRYAAQIADGLAKAHAAGVIHRDLKPGNIMVTRDGLIKLLDFGLARRVVTSPDDSTLTMSRQIAGTPSYMSPEQAQGQEVDTRSDIFSFGSVLYEMLAGRRAFTGETSVAQLEAVLRAEPPALPDVPTEVERLIRLCLRKDPNCRAQHMEDVTVWLRELQEETSPSRPSTVTAPTPHRHRIWAVSLLVLLVLACSAAAVWWFARRSAPQQAFLMDRVTFEPGLAGHPSITRDGKLVTYPSDREGLFQIYVQQLYGRHALKLTQHPSDNWQPSFSPDGSRIAFRSERDGGGIYVVDALGGGERKIASEGRLPRFSPDGSTIAYIVTAPLRRTGKMYLINSNGGTARPFHPEIALPAVGPDHSPAVWSPDGKFLLFEGTREGTPKIRDWWIAPVGGGAAQRAYAPPKSPRVAVRYTEAWSGKYIYYSEGTTVGGISIYRVPIASEPWKISEAPERLTSAAGIQFGASLSADGQMVFTSTVPRMAIRWVGLKSDEAVAFGPQQEMSSDLSAKLGLTAAANGSRIAYVAAFFVDRGAEIRIRDMTTGREDVTLPATRLPWLLRLSPDGSRLAYRDILEGKVTTLLTEPGATSSRPVCDESCVVLDFFHNGKDLLVLRNNQLLRQNLATGRRQTLLESGPEILFDASVNPDDRWVAFTVEGSDGTAALYTAPLSGSKTPSESWTLIAKERNPVMSPKWSPNGRWLYFGSKRDGFPCVWAQRLADNAKPLGAPVAVYHSHQSGGMKLWGVTLYSLTPDQLYTMDIEMKGNIWKINVGSP